MFKVFIHVCINYRTVHSLKYTGHTAWPKNSKKFIINSNEILRNLNEMIINSNKIIRNSNEILANSNKIIRNSNKI